MEEQQEILLKQLEAEGRKIANYRRSLFRLTHSQKPINCTKVANLCAQLNRHLIRFDEISDRLSQLEAVC